MSEVCLVWRRYGGKEGLGEVTERVVTRVFILLFLHVSHAIFLIFPLPHLSSHLSLVQYLRVLSV